MSKGTAVCTKNVVVSLFYLPRSLRSWERDAHMSTLSRSAYREYQHDNHDSDQEETDGHAQSVKKLERRGQQERPNQQIA